MLPLNTTFPADGLTMKYATPARFAPPTVTAVSSAPHSFPFPYITCCIRVSFESSFITTSGFVALWAVALTSSFQQPTPAIVEVVSSLRQ